MVNEDYLQHIGVLGMKWGHRKSQSKSTNNSDDHNKVKTLKKKKLNEMTNAEIRALNERLQLEKQFKDLTINEGIPGKKFVKDILVSSSKDVASQYVKKYGTKGIETIIKKAATMVAK